MHRRAFAAALLIALTACSSGGTVPAGEPTPAAMSAAQTEIVRLLQESAAEWNRGNLDGFIHPYADSPTITYMGANGVVRGKPALRQEYASTWFRGGRPAGQLSFSDIEVRMLGPEHALSIGKWKVVLASNNQERTGTFSIIWQRRPEGWRMVHDHSS